MTELVERDLHWARKITERLRLQATNYAEAREKVIATLIEARDGGASALLGYASWTAYMAEVFGDAPLRLERDARQELVAELAAEGMSTRAIAPIVGVDNATVHRDLGRVASATPEHQPFGESRPFTDEEVADIVASEPDVSGLNVDVGAGEVIEPRTTVGEYGGNVPPSADERASVRDKITGMDGKQYARPEPKKPNRRALTDTAGDAGWNLRKAMEKVERIREDDRYSRNKKEVAELMRGHLMYVIETCQGFLDDINQNEEN